MVSTTLTKARGGRGVVLFHSRTLQAHFMGVTTYISLGGRGGGEGLCKILDLLSRSQIRFNVSITMLLRLNALFVIYILPENTGPHCS